MNKHNIAHNANEDQSPTTYSKSVQAGFLTANGSYDTLKDHPGKQYAGITMQEIAKMAEDPQALDKLHAAWIIPSYYREHDGRSHETQRKRGSFGMLAVDVDEGNRSRDQVVGAIESICGDVHMLCYSSSGATADNMKWRAIVPLKQPISGDDYSDYQQAFFALLEREGITPDYVLSRPGQVMYLPNVPPERRDENGQPLFYESAKIVGERFLTLDADHEIVILAEEMRAERKRVRAEIEAEREKRQIDRELARAENPDQINPIDEFNKRHTVEDMLLRYGYDRLGSSDQWRSRYQSTKSFATKNFGDHWVSMSGSDVAARVGNIKGNDKAAYCWGDAFTLYQHYEHGGDVTAAVRAYGEEINPKPDRIKDDPFEGLVPVEAQADLEPPKESPPDTKPSEDSLIARTVFTPPQAKPILTSNYLVKGWLGQGQMSVFYGPSNVGKSFLVLDMAWCIAAQRDWHGSRVSGGPVLYLATEGGLTFHNRVYALGKFKYHETNIPLYVRPAPVDLLRPEVDMKELGMLCNEIVDETQQPISMIVVDTLSRAMAGGNENGPEDMTAFINNVDKLRNFTKAHVMVVHHSGKDTAAGARGHSSLRAATDTEVELENDQEAGIRFARATKQRDMETGADFAFRLDVQTLGLDQDGDPVTTVVIEPASQEQVDEAKRPKLRGNDKMLWEGFWLLKGEGKGGKNPAGAGWPESGRYWVIDEKDLREHFCGRLAIEESSKRSAWKRAYESLIRKGFLHLNDSKFGALLKEAENGE